LYFLIVTFYNNGYAEIYTWQNVDNFSVNIPSDWERLSTLDSFLSEILKFRHKKYKNYTITLTYKKLINYDSSRNYAHFDADILKTKKYEIVSHSSRNISRFSAYEYIYRFDKYLYSSFEKSRFILHKVYIVIGKKYYSFMFECPMIWYSGYKKILSRIINNIRLEAKTDFDARRV
jgi:hypothetical protein